MIAHEQLEFFIQLLQRTRSAGEIELADWDWLLPLARNLRMHGVLTRVIEETTGLEAVPTPVRWHLIGIRREIDARQHQLRWELNRIERALSGLPADAPVILLKGAAYLVAELPPGIGRYSADLDLLVPSDALETTEQMLFAQGWQLKNMDERDIDYFRRWLHEAPPMFHPYRHVELDVHHNLLPLTDRLSCEPTPFFAQSQPLPGTSRFRRLDPRDLVVHSSIHLMRNGDFSKGFRDLWDLDQLLRHYQEEDQSFGREVLLRAEELGLSDPVEMALRAVIDLFQSPVDLPERRRGLRLKLLDRVVRRALTPHTVRKYDVPRSLAVWLMAHYPMPKFKVVMTPLFWLKRLPIQKK